MLSKRLLAIAFAAALAAVGGRGARAQWVQTNGFNPSQSFPLAHFLKRCLPYTRQLLGQSKNMPRIA